MSLTTLIVLSTVSFGGLDQPIGHVVPHECGDEYVV